MASFQPASHLFERNISLNDLDSALDVREIVRKDVVVPEDVTKHRYLDSSTKHSFVLPSFQDFPIEFRKFVYSFLVDGHILRELETARRINWCHSLGRLVTVNTLGDGNCLMHAASIGMWAVNDRYQTLRKTAYEALLEDVEGFYHGRWKAEEEQQILNQIGGYNRTEEQWNHEWEEVIRLISQTEFPCGPNGAQFGSLAEIHIFVLANILRRSIIVVSDDTLRGPYGDSYSPINFGGIYLPLLWDSVDCVKSPLVIGYANGHFTAVISIEDGKMDLGNENNSGPNSSSNCIHAVPLVKYDGTPLPVHFLFDYEAPLASDRVRQYLDCAKVPFSSNQGQSRLQTVLVAKLHFSEQPRCMKELIDGYFRKAREEHQRVSRHSQLHAQLQPGTKQPALQIVPCQTQGCSFYGSTETGNRCSKCLNEFLRTLGPASCEPIQHVPTGRPIPSPQPVAVTPQQAPITSAWEQTVTTQAAPNTSVAPSMTLPVARSVKCRTTACKYGAMPNRGGLCERCSEAERSAEEMAASMNHMSLAAAKHCSNSVNGCEFFGLPEHHNLCSRCYRTFCLNMENTLGVLSPTGLPPSSPTASTPPDQCQIQGCLSPGVPALYGMCVQCYTRCIHSFIHSQGAPVGGVTQTRPSQPSPPVDVTRKNQLPTGGRNKGVLCASPGCCNEGIFQLSDLCAECHAKNSTPSSQMRNAAVSTANTVSFPVPPPPQSSVTTTAPAATPSHQLTSALTSAIAYNYCSNPMCPNPRRKDGRSLCQTCKSLNTGPLHANSTASLQQPTRPLGAATTASSMPPRQNTPAYSSAMPQTYTTSEIGHPYQVASAQVPLSGADKCAMGCGKRAVQEGGLCEQCYAAAYQLELNRQTVSQPSRPQRPVAPRSVTRNQVEQRNIAETSSGRSLQQAEATAAKKNATLLPCPSMGCMQFGPPEKNGLCDKCYHKMGNQQQGASAATGANEQQGSNQRWDRHNTHTTAENHQFSNSSHGLQGPVQVSQIHSPSCETGVSGQGSSLGNGTFDGQRCRGTYCTLFGTPETNGYCSRCFLESTIPQSYPHSIPDFPAEVSSSVASRTTAPETCRVTGCANVAAADRHGHCQKCFTRYYPDVVHREAVVERQVSELAETVN